jgi:hypothetical protein
MGNFAFYVGSIIKFFLFAFVIVVGFFSCTKWAFAADTVRTQPATIGQQDRTINKAPIKPYSMDKFLSDMDAIAAGTYEDTLGDPEAVQSDDVHTVEP